MKIGIPKEIKNHEYRVGATPYTIKGFVEAGHEVLVQTKAGEKIGFTDEKYEAAGATIASTAKEVYECPMVIKVKEPQTEEYDLLHEGQILFCYLHLAPDPKQTEALLKRKIIGIAYETVTEKNGRLPLLVPMSEVAGRIAVQVGAYYLQMANGGKGVLLGGIPGVTPGRVVVFGGGTVGTEALRMALGLGANVTVFDKNMKTLKVLDQLYAPALKTVYPTAGAIEEALTRADLVVGAVLIPGAAAPKILTRKLLKKMEPGSVMVDVAIDQGGFAETSRATSHSDPTYVEEGVIHYCVTNMPAACAQTATMGLTNATYPFALKLANLGYKEALLEDPYLMDGLNVYYGKVTNKMVADALGLDFTPPEEALKKTRQ